MEKFELVIPAYNEALNLEAVIRRAVDAAKENELTANEFNLVVVQNGSVDESDEVLARLGKVQELKPWFSVVRVEKNHGYGNGLWQGLLATKASIVGWSHADQQCDPIDAIKAFNILTKAPRSGLLLVKGERQNRNNKDQFVSRVFEGLAVLILGVKVHEINAQPKVFRRELLGLIKSPPMTFAFDLYVLYRACKAGYEFQPIEVIFAPRMHGISKWASSLLSRYKTILGMVRYMLSLRRQEGRL